jgi:GNAT superfamily N-acetyltransferase
MSNGPVISLPSTTGTSIVLRRASATDVPGVADVYLQARHAAVPAIPPMVHSDDETREWIATVLINQADVWVAVDGDGPPVAMMALNDGWLEHLYVAPAMTGRRIGAALVEIAKAAAPLGLQLWTFQDNHGARRFYEREGFVIAEMTDGSGNEERTPDVRYVWNPEEEHA